MLETYIRQRLNTNKILLMTHIVIGYPSIDVSLRIIETMVEAGVDLIELQIPFSEPIADGPVILQANQKSLSAGTKVSDCISLANTAAQTFDIPFLFMTYYNILFKYGIEKFVENMTNSGIKGAIVPDLPPEEGAEYLSAMKQHQSAPIYIFTPTASNERMKTLASYGQGFIYCAARKGVTGKQTDFSVSLENYLARCRQNTDFPLAVGFGVKEKNDVAFLTGKADIAVIGTEIIRLTDKHGINAIKPFILSLR